jgi:hypothetical protein
LELPTPTHSLVRGQETPFSDGSVRGNVIGIGRTRQLEPS